MATADPLAPVDPLAPARVAGADGHVVLDQLAVLDIAGERRAEFMQGYFTRDTGRLTEGVAVFGAVCNIKGRVVSTGWLFDHGARLRYRISADLADPQAQMLSRYAPFTRTVIERADWRGVGLLGTAATAVMPHGLEVGRWVSLADGLMMLRCHGEPARVEMWGTEDALRARVADMGLASVGWQQWLLADIVARAATLPAAASEQHLPQVIGLNALHGIDFDKGCYLGQEIVARLQYRGAAKRSLQRLHLPGADRLPGATELTAGGRRVGELLVTALADDGVHALAVLADDAATGPQIDGLQWQRVPASDAG